jgi:hypothetical protein
MNYVVIENGVIVMELISGVPFTLHGIQYPSNWLELSTDLEKTDLGIVLVNEVTQPNTFFYDVSGSVQLIGGVPTRVWQTTDKDLVTLQQQLTEIVKNKANTDLRSTDWYVTRFVEMGTSIPSDISNQRNNIRITLNNNETNITNATSVSILESLNLV